MLAWVIVGMAVLLTTLPVMASGSIRGADDAYCIFTRLDPRTEIVRERSGPLQLDAFRETTRLN
jgi:hypothetical protein